MASPDGFIPAFSSVRLVRFLLGVGLAFWGCVLLGLAWAC